MAGLVGLLDDKVGLPNCKAWFSNNIVSFSYCRALLSFLIEGLTFSW